MGRWVLANRWHFGSDTNQRLFEEVLDDADVRFEREMLTNATVVENVHNAEEWSQLALELGGQMLGDRWYG